MYEDIAVEIGFDSLAYCITVLLQNGRECLPGFVMESVCRISREVL